MHFHIPVPCHENWSAMTPESNGRHCASCCKVVIDFTDWTAEAIRDYLAVHSGEKTCGRFRATQFSPSWPARGQEGEAVPIIARAAVPWSYRVAAIFLLAFGVYASGCTMGAASAAGSASVTAEEQQPSGLAANPGTKSTKECDRREDMLGEVAPVTGSPTDSPRAEVPIILGGIMPYPPPTKDTLEDLSGARGKPGGN